MLNKQIEANKEGRVEEVNKDIIKFNDESVQMKEYYLKDMPEVLKEEAGLVKEKNLEKRSKKEKIKTFKLDSEADLDRMDKYLAAAASSTEGELPDCKHNEKWSIADTGSTVTIANAKETFPGHEIKPSKDSKKGRSYLAADGGREPP